ncbi:valyl-tRNA synthetase [Klebsormidium nitens]|uniref:valine--tRNA ligase n=1 Tax=Klebsormidium nitens TaxID=105231 RepID=A0A1Y1HUG5_KLENI|nr:valyl-tRNA synthetase [Klebsormidium nitens]|eukprot:GAQ82275.1 valyl-tRNA synthetase [Klebsormidium nitens]
MASTLIPSSFKLCLPNSRLPATSRLACASVESTQSLAFIGRAKWPPVIAFPSTQYRGSLLSLRSSFIGRSERLSTANAALSRSESKQRCVTTRALAGSSEDGPGTPAELPKNFDFTAEERLYSWWSTNGYFKPNESDNSQKPFVMSMPPPNVTGALHMGHAMFVTLQDIMARYHRMRGRPVLWLPGTDHAGIATQLVVEKMLAAEGVKRTDLGRDEFVRRVWDWKAKYGGTICNQLRRLGASCDWSRERFTLDDKLSEAVAEAFLRLHDKGLVYRGSYMVNWSPHLQTAVSDLEVEYSEEPGKLFYFRYPIAGGGPDDYLPVATTRPETVLGDTAVAVHPEDERYTKFVGRNAVVPMSGGREIPVIADEYVDREFGTGALKITPGHDPNDYAIGQKVGLPIINIMNKDGSLNENAGKYQGMDRFAVRKQLWADMEAEGLAIKAEPYTLRVPRSQRGGEVVEPLVSKQWFVRMDPLAKPALKAVETGEIKILPERFEKIYNFWLENIRDWCISRQLWWGHRIPVYYVRGSDERDFVVAKSEAGAYEKAREKYGADVQLEQDPDVLDTWFSSGLWPFSTLGWPNEESPDLLRYYPTQVLETGHDILFFWVARMIMMGIEFTGKAPFETVYLHGLVRDAQGRKMSKSIGNVIDPLDSIAEYGTDALRFTLAVGTTPGQDVNLSPEKLTSNKAFTNKLWNAGKFILQNLQNISDPSERAALSTVRFDTPESLAGLSLAERWAITKLHVLIDHSTRCYEGFDFGGVGRATYDFFWSDFADWYIEASKTRLYQTADQQAAVASREVLVYIFDKVLKLLHPFMPFVTEELWQALPHDGRALIAAPWPATGLPQDGAAVAQFETLQALVRSIRNARSEYNVEPGKRIPAIIVARQLETRGFLSEEATVLTSLTKVDPDGLEFTDVAPAGDSGEFVQLVISEGLEAFLPMAGLVDMEKELERLKKQAAQLEGTVTSLTQRLSSPKFVEKAPAAVVQEARDKKTEAEEKLALLKSRLEQMEVMKAPAL